MKVIKRVGAAILLYMVGAVLWDLHVAVGHGILLIATWVAASAVSRARKILNEQIVERNKERDKRFREAIQIGDEVRAHNEEKEGDNSLPTIVEALESVGRTLWGVFAFHVALFVVALLLQELWGWEVRARALWALLPEYCAVILWGIGYFIQKNTRAPQADNVGLLSDGTSTWPQ